MADKDYHEIAHAARLRYGSDEDCQLKRCDFYGELWMMTRRIQGLRTAIESNKRGHQYEGAAQLAYDILLASEALAEAYDAERELLK